MTDDFLTRAWSDNHARLSDQIADAVSRAARSVKIALDRVHAYEFDAPWHHDRPTAR